MTGGRHTRVRPLYVRDGLRYRCSGDGLCCTDIHRLGPLTRGELVRIRRMDRGAACHDADFGAPMLRTRADGGCHFLLPDARCAVHARRGPDAKPGGCRRFPLGLVATPRGGRVTTEHRCPCRTLGERPLLDAEDAESSLRDDAGRLVADRRVDRVSLETGRHLRFEDWERIEVDMLRRLAGGARPLRVLDVRAFPEIRGMPWNDRAEDLMDGADGTRFGTALQWFGAALRARLQRRPVELRPRPWADAFDRAMARVTGERDARDVINDWVADIIWGLEWTDGGSFARGRAELGVRIRIAEAITRRLQAEGVPDERAAAEAVMICDTVGASDEWAQIVETLRPAR